VERLRDLREPATDPAAVVLGAADPAQPYGAAVPWPRRGAGRGPSRTFGAQVVLLDGVPVLYLERGGRSLLALREPETQWLGAAIGALAGWTRSTRGRRVSLERFDGASVFGSVAEPVLLEAGFVTGLRGLELRSESR
jgi:ATP-dependent Lhr-like helicase